MLRADGSGFGQRVSFAKIGCRWFKWIDRDNPDPREIANVARHDRRFRGFSFLRTSGQIIKESMCTYPGTQVRHYPALPSVTSDTQASGNTEILVVISPVTAHLSPNCVEDGRVSIFPLPFGSFAGV